VPRTAWRCAKPLSARTSGAALIVDFDAEIAAALADGVSQVTEGHAFVGVRVGGDDVLAAAAHQLVNGKVFEMAAVGDVNIF
jgi:hypothetical protein